MRFTLAVVSFLACSALAQSQQTTQPTLDTGIPNLYPTPGTPFVSRQQHRSSAGRRRPRICGARFPRRGIHPVHDLSADLRAHRAVQQLPHQRYCRDGIHDLQLSR